MDIGQEPLYRQVEKCCPARSSLPGIQRDFVWSGPQIPRLLDSLNNEWPIGSVLLWTTILDIPTKRAAVEQGNAVGVKLSDTPGRAAASTTLARVIAPESTPKGEKQLDVRLHPGSGEFQNASAVSRQDPSWIRHQRFSATVLSSVS